KKSLLFGLLLFLAGLWRGILGRRLVGSHGSRLLIITAWREIRIVRHGGRRRSGTAYVPTRNGGLAAAAAVQGAKSHGFGACDKDLGLLFGTVGGGRHSGLGVNGNRHDSIGRAERFGVRIRAD